MLDQHMDVIGLTVAGEKIAPQGLADLGEMPFEPGERSRASVGGEGL
jgi:hypothetical protein